jgi:nicotinamidase-related amidase
MAYQPDLSDLGTSDSVNRARHLQLGVGQHVTAPDGTPCTTSICVESTVRDAMFRDYLCVLLADCMSEPIGNSLARSNHDASLLSTEVLLGWTSDSNQFLKSVHA